MTVAHSTLRWRTKNYTDTISHSVETISTQSYTQPYIAVYSILCEHLCWLCNIQLMGVSDRL